MTVAALPTPERQAMAFQPPEQTPMSHLAISTHALRNGGGIERYALTLVRELHQRQLVATLLAKAFDQRLPEYGWVRPLALGVGGWPGKLRDLAFDWRIGRAKGRHGLFPLIGCNQSRWSDIAICGGTHPGFLNAMGRQPRLSDRVKIWLERAHLEASQAVVAHSQRMCDEAVQFYGIDPAKIVLLYPPVDGQRFSPVTADARVALRTRLGLPANRAVFLLASTGHRRKGLGRLVDAFASTSLPATLVVAGRPLGAEFRNVRYLGYRSDIEDVYRAVDFTVMASDYEPFGLVAVESVLCGTPVVLASNAGCAEVLHEPAQLPFVLATPGSLEAALALAAARWQAGTHRLQAPLALLRYDPSPGVHVDALLALASRLTAPPRGKP